MLEMRAAPGCFVCIVGGCWANMGHIAPTCANIAPKMGQYGPKMGQDSAKMGLHSPQDGPT